jgi:hypothetical protein
MTDLTLRAWRLPKFSESPRAWLLVAVNTDAASPISRRATPSLSTPSRFQRADSVDDDEEIAEPTEMDNAAGDFVWDEDESQALRQAHHPVTCEIN